MISYLNLEKVFEGFWRKEVGLNPKSIQTRIAVNGKRHAKMLAIMNGVWTNEVGTHIGPDPMYAVEQDDFLNGITDDEWNAGYTMRSMDDETFALITIGKKQILLELEADAEVDGTRYVDRSTWNILARGELL